MCLGWKEMKKDVKERFKSTNLIFKDNAAN